MGVDLESTITSRFQSFPTKGFGQTQDPHTGAVSLFGMFALTHDDFDKGFSIGTNPCRLAPDLLRRPVIAEPVMGGHMIVVCGMLAIA